jgi:hypothetical protein
MGTSILGISSMATKMTPEAYDLAIRQFWKHYNCSVVSGRRSTAHSLEVKSKTGAGGPHPAGFGTDVEYDTDMTPPLEEAQMVAGSLGLLLLREGHTNGDHLQPLDWVNG